MRPRKVNKHKDILKSNDVMNLRNVYIISENQAQL